jgi:hypothetical protein
MSLHYLFISDTVKFARVCVPEADLLNKSMFLLAGRLQDLA